MALNISSLAIRGFKWSYLSAIVNAVLIMGMTAILARILDPAEFGLVAAANILLRFTTYLTVGIEPAIIQKKDLSELDIRTSFTLSVLIGLSTCGLVMLFAPLAVNVIPSAEIVPVIRVLALALLFNGLSMTAVALLKKELGFRALAKIEIAAYVTGYCVVGLILALNGFGIWSLVCASLTQSLMIGALAYVIIRHGCRPVLDRGSRRHLVSFGGKSTLLSFLEFLGFNVDNLVIGHGLGPAALGLYTRAMALIDLPIQQITTPLLKVSFPAMSQIQNDYVKLREVYASTITIMVVIAVPAAVGLIPAASDLVLTLLGLKWVDAIPILQVLSILIPIAMVTGFMGSICTATGRLNGRLTIQAVFIVALPVVVFAAADQGLTAIAIAVVGAHMVRLVALAFLIRTILRFPMRELGRCLLPGAVGALAAFVTISAVHGEIGQLPSPIALLIEIAVGAVTLAAVVTIMPLPTIVPILRRVQSNVQDLGMGRHVVSWLLRRHA